MTPELDELRDKLAPEYTGETGSSTRRSAWIEGWNSAHAHCAERLANETEWKETFRLTTDQLCDERDQLTERLAEWKQREKDFIEMMDNKQEHTDTLAETVARLRGALERLPIGRAHSVQYYDVDNDPICHENCPACFALKALSETGAE